MKNGSFAREKPAGTVSHARFVFLRALLNIDKKEKKDEGRRTKDGGFPRDPDE
jgi:hypothetical protein